MTITYTFAGGPVRLVEGDSSGSGDAVFAEAKAMLERLNRRNPQRPTKPTARPAPAAPTSQPTAFAAGYLIADAKRRAQAWELSRKTQTPALGEAA
jgi:hypothetical protein